MEWNERKAQITSDYNIVLERKKTLENFVREDLKNASDTYQDKLDEL